MATNSLDTVNEELLKDIRSAALSIRETAKLLTRLSHRKRPARSQAEWHIRTCFFKMKWLAARFKMEL